MKDWYYKVHETCKALSITHEVPLIKVAGIMAALSPNTTFKLNLRSLERFLAHDGDCKVNTFLNQKHKALLILMLKDPTVENIKAILGTKALKTCAFFDNIYRPHESMDVTIDLWMVRWAGIKGSLTPKRYHAIADEIKRMALTNGLKPHELQASMWVSIRGSHE